MLVLGGRVVGSKSKERDAARQEQLEVLAARRRASKAERQQLRTKEEGTKGGESEREKRGKKRSVGGRR